MADSTQVKSDSIKQAVQIVDTAKQVDAIIEVPDTVIPVSKPKKQVSVKEVVKKQPEKKQTPVKDTFEKEFKEPKSNYPDYFDNENFIYKIPAKKVKPDSTLLHKNIVRHTFAEQKVIKHPERDFNRGNIWIFSLYMLIGIAFIWLQLFNRKYISNYTRAVFNFQIGSKIFNEKNAIVRRISLILNTIFFLSISLYTFFLLKSKVELNIHHYAFVEYAYILIAIILVVIAKNILLRIIGYLFNVSEITNEYNFNLMLANKFLGIAVLPLTVFINYLNISNLDIFFGIGILFVLITFVLKLIKGYKLILQRRFLIFYILLYLCTLEILPVAIGIKFYISNSN